MIAKTITLRKGRRASPRAIQAATTVLPDGTYYLVVFYVNTSDGTIVCYRWTAHALGLVQIIESLHAGYLPQEILYRIDQGLDCDEVTWDRNSDTTTVMPIHGGVEEFRETYIYGL